MSTKILRNTKIDFSYITTNDTVIGQAEIELYDKKYSKVKLLLEYFEDNFKIPFVCNKEVIIENKQRALIKVTYEVPPRCKTKLKREILDAHNEASRIALDKHSELYKGEKLSKTSVKKAYVLNEEQIETLDKILIWNERYKRETTSYFVKEVEELIEKLGLVEKQRKKVTRNFERLIQRIVEAEINGEELEASEFRRKSEFGEYVKIDKINYTLESIILDNKEYKDRDIKTIFGDRNVFNINTMDNRSFAVFFE